MSAKKFFVKSGDRKVPVIDVYESFSGWYWFITEKEDKNYWFGFVRGFDSEWGGVYFPELKEQIDKGTVWQVPQSNWAVCPVIESE